ncbi:MAG: ABC transporter ATP-binding protein [Ardenticatenaceae bacterium]|nr:ABC transporter ATP-binding protein [Ardenticatenaceae bacterium]
MAEPILHLDDVHTYYGESYILQGVSLEIMPGEVVALLGRNGVGKTTTIRSIMGATPARRGRILFEGRSIQGAPSHRIARLGIGWVPQGRRIFSNLAVVENLTVAARVGRANGNGWTLERIFERFPRLKERQFNRGNQLSGGEQQMLAIGRALMTNPRLLLMDEPSEGLAPLLVREIGRIIAQLKAHGQSMLLVEQNLLLALSVADRIYVMSKGRLVWEGTPQALWENKELQHKYLGV